MDERNVNRLVLIIMSLFSALLCIISLLNNSMDFTGTAKNAIQPLISMKDTYHLPQQIWRAIDAPWAPYLALVLIMTTETLAGLFSFIGLIKMLRHFRAPYHLFAKGKVWVMLGAGCGILLWGIGFIVIAGEWFLSWQASQNSLNVQLGGMLYAIPCWLIIIVYLVSREDQ